MGKFGKFLGNLKITVGGEELDLKVKVHDIQKLMDVSKTKKNELIEGVTALTNILAKSYPEESREELESFVTFNYQELSEELMVGCNMLKRDVLEAEKKKLEDSEKKI